MHFDLDVVHRRTAALDWFTCPSCGMKSKASVKVKATGHGRAHSGIGNEDASWQGQVHEPQLGGGDELELDLDRTWNKKG